jgi:preprotein translocase subunit SecG
MEAVLITAYLIIVVAMIAVILLQRSEGGALGIGGGNAGGLMTVRGSANLLTRTTAILAALFFVTAIGLTVLTEINRGSNSILQRAADSVGEGGGSPTSVLDALNAMQTDSGLAVPDAPTDGAAAPAADGTTTPAAPAGASDVGAGATNPANDPALAVPAAPADTTPAAPSDSGTTAPATGQPADGATPAAPTN